MSLPLPAEISYPLQIVIFVLVFLLCGMFGISMFFLRRFINKTDLTTEAMAKTVAEVVVKMNDTATKMSETNLSFQEKVNHELYNIKSHATEIEASMERTREKASELEDKFDRAMGKVDVMNEKLSFHDQAITNVFSKLNQHRKYISNNASQLKSVSKQVRQSFALAKSKKLKN